MCEGSGSGAFTWGMMISHYSCVRGRISVHLLEDWRFAVHSCMRGKILVHLLEGWWFRCIHVWGVRFRCIYMRSHDFGAFMYEGWDFNSFEGWWFGAFMFEGNSFLFTWGMIIAVFSCMKGGISINRIFVHLPEELRLSVHSFVRGKIPVHLLERWWFQCFHVWGVGFRCIYLGRDDLRCIHVWEVRSRCMYLRHDDFGAFMCEG